MRVLLKVLIKNELNFLYIYDLKAVLVCII